MKLKWEVKGRTKQKGLTLTWDVLKLPGYHVIKQPDIRLTLTWDVLKWYKVADLVWRWLSININMRCIEIFLLQLPLFSAIWLTLTWDVLKWQWERLFSIYVMD